MAVGRLMRMCRGYTQGLRPRRMSVRLGSRTFILVLLIGVICYTSVRLVNVTLELENIRRVSSRRAVQGDHQFNFQTTQPPQPTDPGVFKYSSFPTFSHSGIDCRAIFEGNKSSISRAKHVLKNNTYSQPSDFDLYKETQDCPAFIAKHGYNDHVISDEERSFPIAYSILLYKDVSQVNVLLKAIYRPQNVYCLHVDGNSNDGVHRTAKAIADCFKNVFIVSKTENIVYAGFSRLQADLNCMQDLLSSYVDWKYFINLPSQQFPLKTNSEIVKILRIYNGANDIEGITGGRMLHDRFMYKHVYVKKGLKIKIERTEEKNPEPPHNITVIKGSAYGVFSRAFVDFVLHDQRSMDLLEWCKTVLSPDEYYWATLHHNVKVLNPPGGYADKPDDKPWLATYASWAPEHCAGHRLRGVCVFTSGDLSYLASKQELFANKFLISQDPVAMMCLEQWLHNKTVSPLPFHTYYYTTLPFVRKSHKKIKTEARKNS